MVYVVLTVVIVMFAGALIAAIAGIADYMSDTGTPTVQNVMTGLANLLFGGAIIVCCVYSQHAADTYAIPAGFCLIGLAFLVAGIVGYRRDKAAPELG